ncbi:MAG: hypothetical protein QW212_00605 [Nitrososphaerales archaeon]
MEDIMKPHTTSLEFLAQVSDNPSWLAGEKFDGYRELWYINEARNDLISSGGNSHIAGLPQFQQGIPELAGTILDCEGMAPSRRLEDNAACFKSSAAIEWQQKHGWAVLVIFDILRYRGRMVVDLPFSERRALLEKVFVKLPSSNVVLETLVVKNKLGYFHEVVSRGGEGIVLKHRDAPYAMGKRSGAWLKLKRLETAVATVVGKLPGVGQFEGLIGSLEVVTDSGYRAWVSGMSYSERVYMTEHFQELLGEKVVIEYQQVTSGGALRHPRYRGMVDA